MSTEMEHLGRLVFRKGVVCAIAVVFCASAWDAGAAVTNAYHMTRSFTPLAYAAGAPTAFGIIMGASNLVGTVVKSGTNVFFDTNATYAVEYESLALGYGTPEEAWYAVTTNYSSNFRIHSNMVYANTGWVKGTRQACEAWGGYLWLLQNHATFKSSLTNIWVSPDGVTNSITNVLVGTVGDYPPMVTATDVGPTNCNGDAPVAYPGAGGGTDIVCKADFSTYYQLGIPVIKVELIPDYDRSGEIDDDDRTKADAGDKFYFWVNDDDDTGIEDDSKSGGQDIPGAVSGWLEFDGRGPDYEDGEVDGERDWVDFFPVFVDLKPTLDLIGTSGYKYVLKHTAGAVNAYIPTDLGPTDAAKHLRDHTYASAHDDATVQEITATGYELPAAFLNAVKDDGKGVILLEGKSTSTSGKLVIEVQKSDGTPICSHELPLSLDGVEKMFRHKNLRAAGGGSGGEADRTNAPNYPDELCNGKQFVFIHGYSVNEQGARGWEAETFKRMYWSRNNGRFHAITWYGNESQAWYTLYKCPNYHNNVVNAWETAPALKSYLAGLSGNVYLAGHSLGNMLASCALMLDSGIATKYFMLNGAVAAETFDAAQYNENMLHKDWIPYEALTDLYASEWHGIFGSGDNRSDLTWQGRFNAIASKTVNFYSSGDEVFDIHLKNDAPDVFQGLWHVGDGRFAWAFQEKRKGTSSFSGGNDYTFSHYDGWSFNDEDPPTGWTTNNPAYDPETDPPSEQYILIDATAAASITTGELVTKPFFGMGAGEFRNNLFTTNTATANIWLTETNKWRVLSGAIPAMSLAAGRASIAALADNIDIDSTLKPSYWPYRGSDFTYDWLHSDIKNMAYIYTFEVFDAMVSEGGLE